MPEIEIRPLIIADIPELTHLDHSYQSEFVWQMDRFMEEGQIVMTFREMRLPRPMRVEYPITFSQIMKSTEENQEILVSLMGTEPVGYIRIKENPLPNVGWITDMAVRPNLRRKGIGKALILAAQDWAAQRNLKRMVCEMQSKNYPGIHMMQKLGYEFCGYNDYYYSNKDIALFFTRFIR
jgi:ribosomal protein S18 acetylase RimI-like enzyme